MIINIPDSEITVEFASQILSILDSGDDPVMDGNSWTTPKRMGINCPNSLAGSIEIDFFVEKHKPKNGTLLDMIADRQMEH